MNLIRVTFAIPKQKLSFIRYEGVANESLLAAHATFVKTDFQRIFPIMFRSHNYRTVVR